MRLHCGSRLQLTEPVPGQGWSIRALQNFNGMQGLACLIPTVSMLASHPTSYQMVACSEA